ncbi:GTP-binding protein [Evansella clarkii]|uniref:GTP-binding protein n=1 Tax=Evansella clarkii TaxID=79879 RepID=UPI000B43D634|nr:GTP-binding protein [Evansella clarkii]
MADEHFIHKTYYRQLLENVEAQHPLPALGEMFFVEHAKENADLSHIRFAQGEMYFHHKDIEAAIYKWENVSGELEPWAKKNIGDAYYELGWYSEAENTYTSIKTDSTVLSVETALQLFSLYGEKGNTEKVYKYIKKAISIDPDYPNVTELARTFYEEQEDWNNAVELAAAEAKRTGSLKWFGILRSYIDNGHTKDFSPEYFYDTAKVLNETDRQSFSQFTASLWMSYKKRDTFLPWMNMANTLFSEVEVDYDAPLEEIAALHHESYMELMTGEYLIKQVETVIPGLLRNWFKFTSEKRALFPAAAVMAWTEYFPSSLDGDTLKAAENVLFNYEHVSGNLEETLDLLQTVLTWAESNQLKMSGKVKWMVSRLTKNKTHLLVTGSAGSGKEEVINSLLNESLSGDEQITMFIDNHPELQSMNEVTEEGSQPVEDIAALPDYTVVELTWPSSFLEELNCSLISTPVFNGRSISQNEASRYLNVSDGMLYVLDGRRPFSEEEFQLLMDIYENAPGLQVHFLLNDRDKSVYDQYIAEEVREKIKDVFPEARVFSFPSQNAGYGEVHDLVEFINGSFTLHSAKSSEQQIAKLISLIRYVLSDLLEKRTAMENTYNDNVVFNEDIMERLKGLVNSLKDTEQDKSQIITESYRAVKEEAKRDLRKKVPGLLKECADYIKEDSDFRNLHEELDERMNEAIRKHIHDNLVPGLRLELQQWLDGSEEELRAVQEYLDGMNETLNSLYEEEKLNLQCDFQVLSDWRRDINRITHRIDFEDENIMNRSKPSQFFLKSAGKLFGNIQQNKNMLYNQYKRAVENDSYEDVTESVVKKTFLEFDLFEKALKADVSLFFEGPFLELSKTITEAEAEKGQVIDKLEKIKQSPEHFYDPLKIFEVRLLQCEMMKRASEDQPYVT